MPFSDLSTPQRQRHPYVAACLVFLLLIAFGSSYLRVLDARDRASTMLAISALAEQRIHAIHSALGTIYGPLGTLADVLTIRRGEMPDFEQFAQHLVRKSPMISAVLLVPDGVARNAYPLKGNEQAIGHDLLADPARRAEVQEAIDTGQIVLAGPVNMRQGGVGLFARQPVFWEEQGQRHLWGLVVALTRWEDVLRTFDLERLSGDGYCWSLQRMLNTDQQAQVIAASPNPLLESLTVRTVLPIPGGHWELALSPATDMLRWYFWGGHVLVVIFSAASALLVLHVLRGRARIKAQADALEKTNACLQEDLAWREVMEHELTRSERKFRNLHESMREGYLETDSQGHIVDCNAVFWEMLGYAREELLGMHFETITPPQGHASTLRIIESQVLTRGYSDVYEKEYIRKDGSVFPVSVRLYLSRDELGEGQGFWGVVRDISWRKQAETELRNAKEAAEAATRAKSEFLATMSHEIRTPMNGVHGMLQLLALTDVNAEQRDYVRIASGALQDLLTLINDILDFSKIEAGELTIFEKDFSVQELCRSISGIFREQLQKKNLALTVDIDSQGPSVLRGDAGRIRQVLINLVGNAVKFTDSGGITIRLSVDPCSLGAGTTVLRVSVEDTGMGIAEQEQANLFEPFQQAPGSYVRTYQGTGLGLSIVRRLVRSMGGEVELTSQLGRGTCVRFFIQVGVVEQGPPKIPVAEEERSASLRGLNLRILLVEDDQVNRLLMVRLLQKLNCETVCAENGLEALQMLEKQKVDAVLMDIQMPVMDGVEATRAIRRGVHLGAQQHVPIIATTAYAMAGDRERFLEAGMNEYIPKPVALSQLKQVLMRLRGLEG